MHFLLGPATVALAVPLYENRKVAFAAILPMLAALAVGSVTAIVSVVLLAEAAGCRARSCCRWRRSRSRRASRWASANRCTPIPSLTAVAVILTGIMGAMIVTPLMNRIGTRDLRARGFAAGVAAHGLGTARHFRSTRWACSPASP